MTTIIRFLLLYIQHLHTQIFELLQFIARFIPIKQWAHEDSISPKYQKLKIDKLPIVLKFEKQDYRFLLKYYEFKYNKIIKPVKRRNDDDIPKKTNCPRCDAPHDYLYRNNGSGGQFLCKVCNERFKTCNNQTKPLIFKCPYCKRHLEFKKSRKHFKIHKCTNNKCSYYIKNSKALPKDLSQSERHKYKLHYIYREFTVNFFKMDTSQLPSYIMSLVFKKNNPHIMGLCLTYHVNLQLSLRKTAQALNDIHGIDISHTTVATYAKTAAVLVKPFVDSFDYDPSNNLAADETYIKVKGLKGYIWFIMDAVSRSILGYQVSNNRGVGPCILSMRMAFDKFKRFPQNKLRFVADGYSAYPLAAQLFASHDDKHFEVTRVIGLTNDDAVSKEFRPYKQKIERLNRTFKSSYRITCGYDNEHGAIFGVALWVAYYNFLRPHKLHYWSKPLNEVPQLKGANNMPAKWQILIQLGQNIILESQMDSS